ncbi:hypothetical protein MBM_01691 [Drepanopeziza brunnea f. sp. 'multigermtubi' MB_m1]|uniref:Uncharacterized protein n=1 Tax=Marssonina brunnea f. sp. multigermtubi (strain MB_m1) TaxID=1072389 RepID=K1Y3K0_MARBU|nr:uncharacterized protein MBM_01691 [Drepanopeziza brunnea f. sp. 'multigermtubi' MB_m1]EKD19739.1 hypothetical protein MBM_01691 [Drepanopeziza brunnea f. sp. 'multigermtubi' MB_m1]
MSLDPQQRVVRTTGLSLTIRMRKGRAASRSGLFLSTIVRFHLITTSDLLSLLQRRATSTSATMVSSQARKSVTFAVPDEPMVTVLNQNVASIFRLPSSIFPRIENPPTSQLLLATRLIPTLPCPTERIPVADYPTTPEI